MTEGEIKTSIFKSVEKHREEIIKLFHMNLLGQDVEIEILRIVYEDNKVEKGEERKWFDAFCKIPTDTLRKTIWPDE